MPERADETASRAPRRERWRRTLWEFGALPVTLFVIGAAVWVFEQFGIAPATVLGAVAILAVYLRVFGWGVERFDITPPKEFREVEDDGE